MKVRLPSTLMAALMFLAPGAVGARANPGASVQNGAAGEVGPGGSGSRGRIPSRTPATPRGATLRGRRQPTAQPEGQAVRPPAGLFARVTEVLDRAGVLDTILRLRARVGSGGGGLPVLCYHSVGVPGPDYHLDPDVVDATPDEFDQQMAMVKRHFDPIGPDELLVQMARGKLSPRAMMVTFDDGYRDNLTQALPILERHRISATFFLATSYIEERRLYWWDRISYLFAHTAVERAELTYPTALTLDIAGDRAGSQRAVLALIKHLHLLDLDRFLAELERALAVPWSRDIEQRLADPLILTWDDVREMQRRGMHFGSHTRSHRILHTLSAAELQMELAGSRDDLRRELGVTPVALAYPGGLPIARMAGVVRAIEGAGYRLGFTTLTGPGALAPTPDLLALGRMPVHRGLTPARFRGMLAVPEVFAASPV